MSDDLIVESLYYIKLKIAPIKHLLVNLLPFRRAIQPNVTPLQNI